MRIKGVVFVATLSAAVCSIHAQVEAPNVMPDAALTITISDAHGFIDEVGAVAAKAAPMFNGVMIKNMLGSQVGDPMLGGLPAGKGLAVVALDVNTTFGVVEIAETSSSNYVAAARGRGLSAEYAEGALVLAQTPEALAKGLASVGAVKSSLLAKRSATLSIASGPSKMIERNRAAIDGFKQMIPMFMARGMMAQPGATLESAQSMSKFLEGYLLVILSLAEQCAALEIKLAPEGGDLELSKTLVAKKASGLSELFAAPKVFAENEKVHSGVFEGGTFLIDMQIANPDALAKFTMDETKKMVEQLGSENLDAAAVAAAVSKWFAGYGGSGAERFALNADGSMSVEYVFETRDEAAALAAIRDYATDLAPLLSIYENMGLKMGTEFRENTREINGVAVHEVEMNIDTSGLVAGQTEQMATMNMTNMVYEVALKDGLIFYATEGSMENLMTRFLGDATSSPIKARSAYPAGGFYYADLDMASYMGHVADMMPDEPATAAAKQQLKVLFANAPAVVSAGHKQDDRVRWSVKVPGDLIAKWGQFAMMMQMQQMRQQQQQGAMPSGVPVP